MVKNWISIVGVLSTYASSPPESRNYQQKDGVLVAIATIFKILHESKAHKDMLEPLVIAHVIPDFKVWTCDQTNICFRSFVCTRMYSCIYLNLLMCIRSQGESYFYLFVFYWPCICLFVRFFLFVCLLVCLLVCLIVF